MAAPPSYLDSLAPDPLKCSVSGCTYSTPVGCPNWDQMVQLLQIHKDSVHQAPAAGEVRVVHDGKLESLITATAHRNEKQQETTSCFTDHRVTPQFGDFDFDKLEQEINGIEADQIKINILELSDEINKIIKSDWVGEERQKVNKYRTNGYPFLTFLYCILVILGIIVISRLPRRRLQIAENDTITPLLIMGLAFVFVIAVAGTCGFCCFCNNSDELDEALGKEVQPVVKRWNESNRQLGVIAEYEAPELLKICKFDGFESESLI